MSAFKKIYAKIIYSSFFIALGSLVWFLLRTGTKPSRAVYPCQQVARKNVVIFGLPIVFPLWSRFFKCPKLRLKLTAFSLFGFLVILLLFALKSNYSLFLPQSNKLALKRENQNLLPQGQVLAGVAGSRVVWVHNTGATNWSGSGYYGDSVNQTVVDTMTDNGLKALTGTSTIAEAWEKLIPNYQVGQKIAQVESPEYLEKVARDRLNLAKPGEVLVVLPKDLLSTDSGELETNQQENWEKWRDLFLK